jgi:hypothetical protein
MDKIDTMNVSNRYEKIDREICGRRLGVLVGTLLIFVLMMASVSALGITPGRTTLDYIPGEHHTVSFSVINNEFEDIDLVVLIEGGLNQSISVSEASFSMSATEETKSLTYILNMPSGLKPGLNEAEVIVVQLPKKSSTSEAFIGASVGVATQVHVHVPFPGKFAEAQLNVIGPNDDGDIIFAIPATSRGDLDLARVRATIDIFGALNEKITILTTNEISIPSGERDEVVVKWSPDVSPGTYRAVATLIYDEETLTLEKQFNVGQRLLELQNIDVNDFSLGGIAKFELLVENKWSDVITGAFAKTLVFNEDDEVIADFKSQTYDIPPLEKVLMVAFWDTAGVRKGSYDSEVSLQYGSQSVTQELKFEVSDNEINIVGVGFVISRGDGTGGGNSLVIILIVAIILLVLINLLWFLVLRKKLKFRK